MLLCLFSRFDVSRSANDPPHQDASNLLQLGQSLLSNTGHVITDKRVLLEPADDLVQQSRGNVLQLDGRQTGDGRRVPARSSNEPGLRDAGLHRPVGLLGVLENLGLRIALECSGSRSLASVLETLAPGSGVDVPSSVPLAPARCP